MIDQDSNSTVTNKNVVTKTVYVGSVFLLLFTAYNIAQGVLTTVFKDVGFYSFALIYFPYALSSLISPWIGRRLGVRFSLLFGSITYVLWMMALSFKNLEFVLIISVINGIGSGLLWVHEGIWLTHLIKSDEMHQDSPNTSLNRDLERHESIKEGDHFSEMNSSQRDDLNSSEMSEMMSAMSESDSFETVSLETATTDSELATRAPKPMRTGFITGVFFCIYNFNGIIGSGVVMILSYYLDILDIIWVMFGVGLLSWLLFWLIPYPGIAGWKLLWNKLGDTNLANGTQEIDISKINTTRSGRAHVAMALSESQTLGEHFRRLGKIWKLPNFVYLPTLMLQCSMLIIFTYGTLPLLLHADVDRMVEKPQYTIGFLVSGLFLCYGVVAAIFSFMWGKLYDRLGFTVVLGGYHILLLLQCVHILVRCILVISGYDSEVSWIWIFAEPSWQVWWVVAAVEGAIDTGAVSLLNIILTRQYDHKESPYVFAWYRFIYCIGLAIFSLLNIAIPSVGIIGIIFIWSLLTFLVIKFKGTSAK